MDEIVKQISERTGISEDQARQAATMVADFIKSKLPEPIALQVDSLIAGQVTPDAINQAMGMLGGMFGSKS